MVVADIVFFSLIGKRELRMRPHVRMFRALSVFFFFDCEIEETWQSGSTKDPLEENNKVLSFVNKAYSASDYSNSLVAILRCFVKHASDN